jgi:hypothetical protein
VKEGGKEGLYMREERKDCMKGEGTDDAEGEETEYTKEERKDCMKEGLYKDLVQTLPLRAHFPQVFLIPLVGLKKEGRKGEKDGRTET